MPIVTLRYKRDSGQYDSAAYLAQALPVIIATNLTIPERERHDGIVTPEDIIVHLVESGEDDVNNPVIEIIVLAHDFPERKANLQERTDAIIRGVNMALGAADGGNGHGLSGFVWVLLQPTAFGQL